MSYFWKTLFRRKESLLLFLPMVLLYAASYFQRTAVPGTIFDQLQSDLGLIAVQIAGIGASFIYVYAFSQLLVGMLADKYSGVRVMAFGGLLFCIGTLLFPLFDTLWMLYLCRMLAGMGASTMYLSLVKETDRLFGHKNYALIIGIVYFIGYGGGLFGTLPFERLTEIYSWRWVLLGTGVFSLLLYLWFLKAKKKVTCPPPRPEPLSFTPLLKIMKNPLSWLVLYCATVNFAIYFIIQTVFGKKFLEDFAGMSSFSAASVIFSLTVVCMMVLFSSGLLSRLMRNRRKPLILFSTGFCFFNTLVMLLAIRHELSAWIFVCCYLGYAFASGFSVIFTMTEQEVNSPEVLTQATGFINMCNYLAVAFFSVLVGMLLDTYVPGAREGKAVVYPKAAYLTLFYLLLIPVGISFAASFFIPETRGKYHSS